MAAKAMARPAIALFVVTAAIVWSYYYWPGVRGIFEAVARWQEQGGFVFSGIAGGLAGGLIPELLKVALLQRGHWTRRNTQNAVFVFILWFFGWALCYWFYVFQATVFGASLDWLTILKKTVFEQLIYGPLLATPVDTVALRWKNLGFDRRRLAQSLRTDFIREYHLPTQVSSWCFWAPVAPLIYCLPLMLQTPVAIFLGSIWALVYVTLGEEAARKN